METSFTSIKFRCVRSSATWWFILLVTLMMVIAVTNANPTARKEGTTVRKMEHSAFSFVSFQLPSVQKKRRSNKEVATLGVAFEKSLDGVEEDNGATNFQLFNKKGKNGGHFKKMFVPNAAPRRVSSSSRLQSAVYPTAAFLSEKNDNGLTSTSSRDNKRRILMGLTKVSNMASLLCVIDCTVLPIITVILPLLGLVSMSPAQSQWLHELGHRVALGFVMPVGGLASITNFWNHRNLRFSSLSLMGLCLIYAANAGHHAPLISMLPHHWAHALHCGTWLHRITNILGCALLLSSNYFSHRAAALQGNNCCGPNGICANNEDDDVEIFFDRQRV